MDLLNSLQVKSSEKVLKGMIWSTVNGATVCFKSEICVFERVKIHSKIVDIEPFSTLVKNNI